MMVKRLSKMMVKRLSKMMVKRLRKMMVKRLSKMMVKRLSKTMVKRLSRTALKGLSRTAVKRLSRTALKRLIRRLNLNPERTQVKMRMRMRTQRLTRNPNMLMRLQHRIPKQKSRRSMFPRQLQLCRIRMLVVLNIRKRRMSLVLPLTKPWPQTMMCALLVV